MTNDVEEQLDAQKAAHKGVVDYRKIKFKGIRELTAVEFREVQQRLANFPPVPYAGKFLTYDGKGKDTGWRVLVFQEGCAVILDPSLRAWEVDCREKPNLAIPDALIRSWSLIGEEVFFRGLTSKEFGSLFERVVYGVHRTKRSRTSGIKSRSATRQRARFKKSR
jgi:hypothetical protein